MISIIHTEHATIAAISNLWFARYPAQWRRMLAVANLLDVPLLALVYDRLRELRDGVARDAFERQEDFGVIAWEWRQRIVERREARGAKTTREPCDPTLSAHSAYSDLRHPGQQWTVGPK